jgi:hypothetical protein
MTIVRTGQALTRNGPPPIFPRAVGTTVPMSVDGKTDPRGGGGP